MYLSNDGMRILLRRAGRVLAQPRRGLFLTLSVLVACVAARADGGAISGQVRMPNGVEAAGASVIWLDAPGLHAAPLPRAVIDQRNKTFMPHILVVTPGTKVEFPNDDTVFHNVFAYFEAKRFDLGMYPRGTTKSQIFERPGVVAVLCNVHASMSAFIIIADSPYRTSADKNGEFQIKDVHPGTYTIHVWHESGAVYSAKVTIAEGDNALQRLTLLRT